MLPAMIATDVVVRVRGIVEDDTHHNSTVDWDNPDRLTIHGCSVQGQLGTESLGGRDTVTWAFTWFGNPDADVVAYDRIEFDGRTYDVDGPVVPMHDPTGLGLDHKMAKLTLVEG